MSIESAVYTVLSGNAGVTAYTGSRVYAYVAPEGTDYPLVVYNATSESPVNVIGTQRESGLRNKTIQVDCWTKTAADANGLADAVRVAMHGMTTARAVRISQTTNFDNQTMLFRASLDFSVWAAA